jgi:hypothetical protein
VAGTIDAVGDGVDAFREDLRNEVSQRIPLTDLAAIHAQSSAGSLRGRVIVLPTA